MSGRLLSFSQYIGGADGVKVLEMFPGDQRAFTYNFNNADVSGYTFSADYQSILLPLQANLILQLQQLAVILQIQQM
jgi:hypothetical protein